MIPLIRIEHRAEVDKIEVAYINEEHVSSFLKTENGETLVKMSNGDFWHVVKPSYEEWENDYLTRKT